MKKTVEDAVRELDGVWPTDAKGRISVGWNGPKDGEPHFIRIDQCHPEITRPEFEAAAARMGYPRCTVCGHNSGGKCNGHCINANPPEWLHGDENWHERGELPPVGTVCEYNNAPKNWIECEVFGHRSDSKGNVSAFVNYKGGHNWDYSSAVERFRPRRTDRERWVEQALSAVKCSNSYQLGEVYDAMLSGELPAPGGSDHA